MAPLACAAQSGSRAAVSMPGRQSDWADGGPGDRSKWRPPASRGAS